MIVPPNKRPRIDVARFLKKIGKAPDMHTIMVHFCHISNYCVLTSTKDPVFRAKQIELALGLDKKLDAKHHLRVRDFQTRLLKLPQMKMPVLEVPSVPPRKMFTPSKLTITKDTTYQINKGNEVVTLEVIPKENGCYDGRLRFGSSAQDMGESSEYFSMGTLHSTHRFVHMLREVETRVFFFAR